MTNGTSDALLLETFGPRLLAYLANVKVNEVEARFREDAPLPQRSQAALAELVPLAERIARERLDQPGLPLSYSLELLGLVREGSDVSIGNEIRLGAGGNVDAPSPVPDEGADAVLSVLLRLARDAYPQLLVPVDEPWRHIHLSFFRHPMQADLQRAVHEDADLGRMYPSDDGQLGRRGEVFNSLGRGGSVQSVMFGETMVRAAWDLALMTNDAPALADLYEAVTESLAVLRSALAGDEAETRALISFTGFTTGGRSISTPWGPLRPIGDQERTEAPSMLEGAVSGTDAEGRSVTVNYAGEMVLDTTLPFAATVRESSSGDDVHDWPTFESLRGAQALRRRSDGIRLAVLLGVERPAGQWATARFAWHWMADPTSHGRSMGWSDPKSSPGFMPTELSSAECEVVADWCELVETNWSSRVDIAVRRVLSAAQVRNDAADRLVDSVIAWENLFGTSEGEPRLRISSAMAWLLAETAAERSALQREIKRLYDDRSKIVHGGTFDEAEVAEKANRALELARSCLQVLFKDRPEILSLSDGSARSLALILDSQP